jgi:chemotaxis protein CheZ
MDSHNLAIEIAARLKKLKAEKGDKLSFDDISNMLVSIIETTSSNVSDDNKIVSELEGIRNAIKDAKGEAADILNDGESQMPDASNHLDEVVKETEEAANKIIDLASEIQSAVPDNAAVADLVTKIYEACNFGDLSRQRIVKVLKHLDIIESKLVKIFDSLNIEKRINGKPSEGELLLNGPQLSGSAPTQDDIDALFNNL